MSERKQKSSDEEIHKLDHTTAPPNDLKDEICDVDGNYDSIIRETERRIKLKSEFQKVRLKLNNLVDQLDDSDLSTAFDLLSSAFFKARLPLKAPNLYKNREKKIIGGEFRKAKPDEFIRAVYKDWLGKGLLRPHIKQLDEPLYRALYKFGVPDDFEALLPKAQGSAAEHLSRSDAETLQRRRSQTRASARRLRNK